MSCSRPVRTQLCIERVAWPIPAGQMRSRLTIEDIRADSGRLIQSCFRKIRQRLFGIIDDSLVVRKPANLEQVTHHTDEIWFAIQAISGDGLVWRANSVWIIRTAMGKGESVSQFVHQCASLLQCRSRLVGAVDLGSRDGHGGIWLAQ